MQLPVDTDTCTFISLLMSYILFQVSFTLISPYQNTASCITACFHRTSFFIGDSQQTPHSLNLTGGWGCGGGGGGSFLIVHVAYYWYRSSSSVYNKLVPDRKPCTEIHVRNLKSIDLSQRTLTIYFRLYESSVRITQTSKYINFPSKVPLSCRLISGK